MNGFQIKDKNGKPIPISQLDREVAELWDKEVDDKKYATPLKQPEGLSMKEKFDFMIGNKNWFDGIMWHVADKELYNWKEVRAILIKPYLDVMEEHDLETKDLYEAVPHLKKYIELIEHWNSKGYQPLPIIERKAEDKTEEFCIECGAPATKDCQHH